MKNVPELRFAGFDGEWEEKKFSEKFNTTIPKNSLSRDKLTNEPTKIKNIHYGDIHKVFNNYVNSSNDFIPYIIDDDISYYERYLLHDGDIVFADAAEDNTAGKCVELDIDDNSNIVAGLHTIPARPNQSGKYFFGFYLNSSSFHNKIIPLLEGTKVSSISKTNLNTLSVVVPEIDEQEKIGSLFKKISALIEKQEDKVSNMEDLKKSMLQKTFPKKGELVPEFRFKGFDGKWIKIKLEKILKIPDKVPIIIEDYKNIISVRLHTKGAVRNLNSNLSLGSTNYYKRFHGQLIYGKQNIFNGAIALIDEKFDGMASSADIPSLDIVDSDGQFIITYMSRPIFYKNTEKMSIGTGSKRLHEKDLLNMVVIVPKSIEEQEKIGKFFKTLDTQIETEKKLLDSYKMMKKSLLQKMFV